MKHLIFILLSLLCFSANAVKMTQLYTVDLPLKDTSKETIAQVQNDALAEVFIRTSGQKTILQNAEIQKALESADRYIMAEKQHKKGVENYLALTFSDEEISKTLSKAKSTLWGSNRPQVIVWQVTEESEKKIEWDQKPNTYTKALKRQAEYRGLPVLLPIGDLEDIDAISESDIWGGFTGHIVESSLRYSPDSILVIKLTHSNAKTDSTSESRYQLAWQFFEQSPSQLQQNPDLMMDFEEGSFSGTLSSVYRQVIDLIADKYALKYAISMSGQSINAVELRVKNVKSKRAYYKLERVLTEMSSVQSLYPTYMDGETMGVKVMLKTNIHNFLSELESNSQLQKLNPPASDTEDQRPEVEYTYVRLR